MIQAYEEYMTISPFETCYGQRLKKTSLAVTINNKNIPDVCELSISDFYEWIYNLKFSERQIKICELVLKEIKTRIKFLIEVGLDYLSYQCQQLLKVMVKFRE